MRLVVIASVDQGTKARHHLYHRTVIALPEATGGKLRGAHIVGRVGKAHCSCFPRKINVCFQPEIKNVLKLRKSGNPCGLSDIHHVHVTGTFDSLSHRQRPVSPCIMAFDGPVSLDYSE